MTRRPSSFTCWEEQTDLPESAYGQLDDNKECCSVVRGCLEGNDYRVMDELSAQARENRRILRRMAMESAEQRNRTEQRVTAEFLRYIKCTIAYQMLRPDKCKCLIYAGKESDVHGESTDPENQRDNASLREFSEHRNERHRQEHDVGKYSPIETITEQPRSTQRNKTNDTGSNDDIDVGMMTEDNNRKSHAKGEAKKKVPQPVATKSNKTSDDRQSSSESAAMEFRDASSSLSNHAASNVESPKKDNVVDQKIADELQRVYTKFGVEVSIINDLNEIKCNREDAFIAIHILLELNQDDEQLVIEKCKEKDVEAPCLLTMQVQKGHQLTDLGVQANNLILARSSDCSFISSFSNYLEIHGQRLDIEMITKLALDKLCHFPAANHVTQVEGEFSRSVFLHRHEEDAEKRLIITFQ